jgi:hypothetical protein
MNENWYVLSEGQQLGPYTGEQLVQYAKEGRIATETMVWADGMADWVTASQVPGLFAQQAPAAAVVPAAAVAKPAWAPPGARPAGTTTSPYAAPASSLVPTATGGSYPFLSIKPAGFGLWMWTFLGGVLCFILMIVFFISGGVASANASSSGDLESTAGATQMMLGMSMYGLSILLMIVSMIFFYINIYRAWNCLRAGAPRTTPGAAVGMLFIPFYNLYWLFVGIGGLPKDWNRIMDSYEDLHTAPRLSESVFLMFCIGSLVFPPLSLCMMFPMMSQICKGVNFFAYRRNPSSSGTLGTPGFGGVRFG